MPGAAENAGRRGGGSRHPDRDVRLLYALGGVSTAALLPFLALLLRDRGLTPEQIGLALAASAIAGVAAAPAWSHVADTRLGSARTLRISSVAAAAAALALRISGSNPWAILAVVVVLGATEGPGTALADALALGHLGPGRMNEYGTIRLWASIGWAIAVLGFGAWFERTGLGPVLPAYAVGVLLYAGVTTRFTFGGPIEPAANRGSPLGSVGDAFRSAPRLVPFLLGLLLVTMATSASWNFVPLRIAAQGGGPFLIGLAASVAAVIEIPFMRASAPLTRRVGLRILYSAGVGIYVVMMIGWALVADPLVVALIKMASGAGFGLTYVSLVVITGRLMPDRLRNTGQALMHIAASGLGPIVGSALGGIVYQRLGPPTLFAWAAVLAAAGALIVWRTLSGEAFRRPAPAHSR